jgi:hypothetical protein
MTRIRRWWDDMEYAWEAFLRAQRPWEQDGPLRWHKPVGGRWELHGATVPEDERETA